MHRSRGHEHKVSLTFKYAYGPSRLRRAESLISPHGSQTNLVATGNVNHNLRPSVCSPSSTPLRQDATYQSFPSLSPRGSPQRSQGMLSRQITPQQIPTIASTLFSPGQSPRASPRVTPQRTPVSEPDQLKWTESQTESSLVFQVSGSDASPTMLPNSPQATAAPRTPMDGPDSPEFAGSQKLMSNKNSNDQSESLVHGIDQHDSLHKRRTNDRAGKQAAILGVPSLSPHPESSGSSNTKHSSSPASDSFGDRDGVASKTDSGPLRPPRNLSWHNFIRGSLTFPIKISRIKNPADGCFPRKARKGSHTAPLSLEELPNNRISQQPQSQSQTKSPTLIDASKAPLKPGSPLKRHPLKSWHSKHRDNDMTSNIDSVRKSSKPEDEHEVSCFVGGEAYRLHTPITSPRIPKSPLTPSPISPKADNQKSKNRLPSYFDLQPRESPSTSPFTRHDRGFTLIPLNEVKKKRRHGKQTQTIGFPHLVQVPTFSRVAPFANTEDYSGGATPEASSRRSSYPPEHGSLSRSSTAEVQDGQRRASFGYRDHMGFITKPDGYSTGDSSDKQTGNSSRTGSGSSLGLYSTTRSRKSSLGERRASKVMAQLEQSHKQQSENKTDDDNENSEQPKQPEKRLVHWRGAEVTEEEARILDMLIGGSRLLSDVSMSPLDGSQTGRSTSEPDQHPASEEVPMTTLRRPSWRRFASTVGSSPPLSGLREESSPDTPRPKTGDGVRDARELYADAVQETHGMPIRRMHSRKRREGITSTSDPESTTGGQTRLEFITTAFESEEVDPLCTEELGSPSSSRSSTTTTPTKRRTEIVSFATRYSRVIEETTKQESPTSSKRSSVGDASRPSAARTPSTSTLPDLPSAGSRRHTMVDRSRSDSGVPGLNRTTTTSPSSSRRSSTLSLLQRVNFTLNKGEREKDTEGAMIKIKRYLRGD
ncbi:hypothetical protein ABW21_db0203891 [Orbilia brochopaga]|nr:hypothetical protein ABW21_db0203891 [Drechslerella brochopaga]